jgi:hypothetical protein
VFADPQSVVVGPTVTASTSGGTTVSLPRTGSGDNSGAFRSSDGNVGVTINHSSGKGRIRDTFRLNHRKVAADPFTSTVNAEYSMSVILTVDHPAVGYTIAEAKAVVDGFIAFMAVSSGAKVTQLLGGES